MGINLLVYLTQQPFHGIITQIEMGPERHNNLLGILTFVDSNFLNSITSQVYLENANRFLLLLSITCTKTLRVALILMSRWVWRRLKLWRRLQMLLGLLVALSGREVHRLLLEWLFLWWAVILSLLLWRIKWWLLHWFPSSWTEAIVHYLSSRSHLLVRVLMTLLRVSLVEGLLLLLSVSFI